MKNKLNAEQIKEFKNKLTLAFRNLRKSGYIAKQKFMCCQSCGWAAIESENPNVEKVVFYHVQDDDRIPEGTVMLAWAGDGQEICNILEEAGLFYSWNEQPDNRIEVLYQSRPIEIK